MPLMILSLVSGVAAQEAQQEDAARQVDVLELEMVEGQGDEMGLEVAPAGGVDLNGLHAELGEPAAGRRFGRGIEDRRRPRGAGLPPVAEAGQGGDAAADQRRGRLHVHDLGAARVTDRAGAADHEDCGLVDAEFRAGKGGRSDHQDQQYD